MCTYTGALSIIFTFNAQYYHMLIVTSAIFLTHRYINVRLNWCWWTHTDWILIGVVFLGCLPTEQLSARKHKNLHELWPGASSAPYRLSWSVFFCLSFYTLKENKQCDALSQFGCAGLHPDEMNPPELRLSEWSHLSQTKVLLSQSPI